MDDIEHLVEETFKHFHTHFSQAAAEEIQSDEAKIQINELSFPEGPGVLYHIQKTSSVFVLRTFASKSIKDDYMSVIEGPENYPTLRLLQDGQNEAQERLKFFIVDDFTQAEIIHDQLHNRRFPIYEEMICNLSDPGFSWWLTQKSRGFQISFTMSVASSDETIKLGPLGDKELAIKNFQILEKLVSEAGIGMNVQNETNRVQFTDCEDFLLEELKDVFEFGVITDTLRDIFKILSLKSKSLSQVETIWFFLQELAAMRRFWIQVEYDLSAELS